MEWLIIKTACGPPTFVENDSPCLRAVTGPEHRPCLLHSNAMSERTEHWKDLYLAGMSTDAIGKASGVTGQRVRQVLSALGYGSRNGGPYQKARERKALKKAAWLATYLPAFGCSRCEAIAINDGDSRWDRPKARAYIQQRHNALRRGIAWDLPFPMWWFLWSESGKWEDRGRHSWGLSRINYAEGFHFDNVRICLQAESAADNIRQWRARKHAA